MMKFIVLWLLPNVTFRKQNSTEIHNSCRMQRTFFEMQGSAYFPCLFYQLRAQQRNSADFMMRCKFFQSFSIVTCILLIDSNDVCKSSACCEEFWPFRCTHISANQEQKQTIYCEWNNSKESSSQSQKKLTCKVESF